MQEVLSGSGKAIIVECLPTESKVANRIDSNTVTRNVYEITETRNITESFYRCLLIGARKRLASQAYLYPRIRNSEPCWAQGSRPSASIMFAAGLQPFASHFVKHGGSLWNSEISQNPTHLIDCVWSKQFGWRVSWGRRYLRRWTRLTNPRHPLPPKFITIPTLQNKNKRWARSHRHRHNILPPRCQNRSYSQENALKNVLRPTPPTTTPAPPKRPLWRRKPALAHLRQRGEHQYRSRVGTFSTGVAPLLATEPVTERVQGGGA